MEDIIKQRVLEERWDDIVPEKPAASSDDAPLKEVSQKKSARGLAEELATVCVAVERTYSK